MADLARTARVDVLVEGYARLPNVAGTVTLVRDAGRVVVFLDDGHRFNNENKRRGGVQGTRRDVLRHSGRCGTTRVQGKSPPSPLPPHPRRLLLFLFPLREQPPQL